MAMKKGFSLIELMVVIGIIGVLLTVGMNLFFQVVMSANKATTEADLRQNASLVMETISREVRKGSCLSSSRTYLLIYQTADCSGIPVTINVVPLVSPSIGIYPTFVFSSPKQVTVTLVLTRNGNRSDFQGSITETQTISVRN
ncbi:MAG: type II secretion system protein [bacterium]|nr:type II secretion system protein [bacterium]